MTAAQIQYTARRPLTAQQERVVDGVRRGLKYPAIAQGLGISTRTVEGYITVLMGIIPNPDHLSPRMCIFLWAHHRVWEAGLRGKAG